MTRKILLSKRDIAGLERVKGFIDQDPGKQTRIEELTHLGNLNRDKLNRGFKQVYGTNVRSYLLSARMQYAKRLLEEDDAPLKFIAVQCGFSGRQNFITAFRKYYGETPGRYQKRMRTDN